MDTTIVFVLVVSVLVFGGLFWLVMYSRRQGQKHTMPTTIKPPQSQSKNRAA